MRLNEDKNQEIARVNSMFITTKLLKLYREERDSKNRALSVILLSVMAVNNRLTLAVSCSFRITLP